MPVRKGRAEDAAEVRELYHEYLAQVPQDAASRKIPLAAWKAFLARKEGDEDYHLLVYEQEGRVVSSVTLVIVENMTHGFRPYGVMENVVTHPDFRCRGYASALIRRGAEIARERGCYKIMLMTSSRRESTLNFYRNNGFSLDIKTACLMRLE